MTNDQTTAIAGLGGAALGGIGGYVAGGKSKILYSLGGAIVGGLAGAMVATFAQKAVPAKTAAPVGAGRLPPHIAAIM